MKFPSFLKMGDVLGITAPSFGIREEDVPRYQAAKHTLSLNGFECIETPNVHTLGICASDTANERARQLRILYTNSRVKGIISAGGGELELLIADKPELLNAFDTPKWFCGYSDNTVLTYLLTARFDIASVYGYNICSLGDTSHISSQDHIALLMGKKLAFTSYDKHIGNYSFTASEEEKAFDTPTVWKNLHGNGAFSGRLIGGCLDILSNLCGTRQDSTKAFNEKYGKEGIIWFLETCDLTSAGTARALWQLKNAGWFDCASGFIFGRPYISDEMLGLSFEGAVTELLGDTGLPVITGADIGHIPPMLPMLCGAYATVTCKQGKGKIVYELLP